MTPFFQILLLFGICGAPQSSRQESDDDLIATVSGIAIVRRDIAVPADEARFRYKLQTGQPSGAEHEGEIEEIRQQLERRRLASEIERIVVAQTKARLGVTVTEAEVLARWHKRTRGLDFDAAAKTQRDYITPLLAALKAVYEEGQDAKEVYDRILAEKMPLQEWEVQSRYYRTPARREALERALAQTAEDLSKPDAGARAAAEAEKLNETIDAQIAKNDPSFAEYLELRGSKRSREQQLEYPPYFLEEMRGKWWAEQYRTTKIVVVDDRYRGVLDMLVVRKK